MIVTWKDLQHPLLWKSGCGIAPYVHQLWGCIFFCIFLHLFAFICIFLHRIFSNLNLHFFPPSVVGSIPGTGVSGIGRQQPCFKGILSGNVAELSRPWRVT